MTLEEAQARIKVLETEATAKAIELVTATNKVSKLTNENAERRVVNTQQKKALFAHKAVIDKNNIKVDFDTLGVDGLTLNKETGVVEGDVSYNPASVTEVGGGVPPSSGNAPEVMTVESIQGMSRTDIAKNWDAVSEVLTSQATQTTNTI